MTFLNVDKPQSKTKAHAKTQSRKVTAKFFSLAFLCAILAALRLCVNAFKICAIRQDCLSYPIYFTSFLSGAFFNGLRNLHSNFISFTGCFRKCDHGFAIGRQGLLDRFEPTRLWFPLLFQLCHDRVEYF
jgi:hypothetical protein